MLSYIKKHMKKTANSRKGEMKMIKNQDNLRRKVKLAKALNEGWSYKAMSEIIQISNQAFYNWLNGAY